MEQEKRRLRRRAARWERRLLTALATALSAELFVNVWVDNFRVSGAVVLYPGAAGDPDAGQPETGHRGAHQLHGTSGAVPSGDAGGRGGGGDPAA